VIIVLGSRKGGCGKSTLATSIAAELAATANVCLVDADRQESSAVWAAERGKDPDAAKVTSLTATGESLRSTLSSTARRFDHLVVDTAGRDSSELRSALLVADIAIFPFRVSQADLFTLDFVENLVAAAQKLNPKLVARTVISAAPTTANGTELKGGRRFLELSNIPPLNSTTFDRKAYRHAYAMGLGASESGDIKARKEIADLTDEIRIISKRSQSNYTAITKEVKNGFQTV
jgi:chromosome partitioning protein